MTLGPLETGHAWQCAEADAQEAACWAGGLHETARTCQVWPGCPAISICWPCTACVMSVRMRSHSSLQYQSPAVRECKGAGSRGRRLAGMQAGAAVQTRQTASASPAVTALCVWHGNRGRPRGPTTGRPSSLAAPLTLRHRVQLALAALFEAANVELPLALQGAYGDRVEVQRGGLQRARYVFPRAGSAAWAVVQAQTQARPSSART